MSLFGHGSLFSARLAYPESLLTKANKDQATELWLDDAEVCVEQTPLMRLFGDPTAAFRGVCTQDNLI